MRKNIVYVIVSIICLISLFSGCTSSEVFVEQPVVFPTIHDNYQLLLTRRLNLLTGAQFREEHSRW